MNETVDPQVALLRSARGHQVALVGGPLCGELRKAESSLWIHRDHEGRMHEYVLARPRHARSNYAVIYAHARSWKAASATEHPRT